MRYLLLTLLLLTSLGPLPASAASSLFQQEANPMSAHQPTGTGLSALTQAHRHGGFLPVDDAFQLHAWREHGKAWVGFNIHEGYYLYRSRLHLQADDPAVTLGQPRLPPGTPRNDRFMGQVQVYHHQLVFATPIEQPVNSDIKVTLDYQGCAEKGLCYAPEHRQLTLHAGTRPAALDSSAAGTATTATTATSATEAHPAGGHPSASAREHSANTPVSPPDNRARPQTSVQASESPAATQESPPGKPVGPLQGVSLWQLMLLFVAGIGLVFTPCVLPMLPIVAALVVGQARTARRALLLSGCYVAGMVIVYAALGLAIGLLGASLDLQARMQSPWVVVPFALLFVALAAFTMEWLRLPNTGIGNRVSGWEERFRQMGPLGLMLAGGLSTLIVSPCLSAPLAGVLGYLSTTGNALGGALSLLALGLGMGIPLMLVSVFGSSILPGRGSWMERVRNLCALVLLAVALWLVASWLAGPVVLILTGLLAIAAGLCLGLLEPRAPLLLRAIAMVAVLWGICCVVGAALGHHDVRTPLASSQPSLHATATAEPTPPGTAARPHFRHISRLHQLDQAIAQAAADHQPVMVDLYADWCVACKEMEATLFTQPRIVRAMQGITLIRFDLTADNADARALLKRYGLFGPPTLLFFKSGHEMHDLRLQGEPSSDRLHQTLTALSA